MVEVKLTHTDQLTALKVTPRELAIAMVDGTAALENGEIKWGDLSERAQEAWVEKAEAALRYIQISARSVYTEERSRTFEASPIEYAVETLQRSARVFRCYENLHKAKPVVDPAKVQDNKLLADRCESAVARFAHPFGVTLITQEGADANSCDTAWAYAMGLRCSDRLRKSDGLHVTVSANCCIIKVVQFPPGDTLTVTFDPTEVPYHHSHAESLLQRINQEFGRTNEPVPGPFARPG